MRVVLEVTSGPSAKRKTVLGAGQVVQVGRTEWADFSVPQDGHMSGVHFALRTDNANCYVEDLGSSNGTFVNDQPLAGKTRLHNGDKISAGQTHFVVRVEGGATEDRQTPVAEAPTAAFASAAATTSIVPGRVTYKVERCNSKLPCYRGSGDEIQPVMLASLLGQQYPLYLVVDFNRLEVPQPEEVTEPEYLFNWLPEESRAKFSPIILSASDKTDLFSLLEKAWGQDAVVCIFYGKEKSKLLDHLRRTAGAYARPSIVKPHLQLAPPEAVCNLFVDIDAVLLEGDSPDEWVLFGSSQFRQTLDKLGFRETSTAGN